MKKLNKKSAVRIRKVLFKLSVTIILISMTILGFFWNRYLNKNSLIASFETNKSQTVYLLGTIHKTHFKKSLGYSMEDIISAIKNIDPDYVFIEAREEIYNEYGVVDGPVDMAVAYSYCKDHDIQVRMIDWWVIDNQFKSNSTNEKRDNKIFENISHKLSVMPSEKKVLVLCGSGHFYEQSDRFVEAGFIRKSIKNKNQIFKSNTTEFLYPVSLESIWEKRAFFYAYTQPEIVEKNQALNAQIKADFTEGNRDNFYKNQLEYCELFRNNKLYDSE